MTPIKFKPMRDQLLLESVHDRPVVGNIVIPQAYVEERPAEAVVIAKGARVKGDVQVGDRVLTDRYAGDEVYIGARKFRLLREVDVLARLDDTLLQEATL
jgi:chaperonin GroES